MSIHALRIGADAGGGGDTRPCGFQWAQTVPVLVATFFVFISFITLQKVLLSVHLHEVSRRCL